MKWFEVATPGFYRRCSLGAGAAGLSYMAAVGGGLKERRGEGGQTSVCNDHRLDHEGAELRWPTKQAQRRLYAPAGHMAALLHPAAWHPRPRPTGSGDTLEADEPLEGEFH